MNGSRPVITDKTTLSALTFSLLARLLLATNAIFPAVAAAEDKAATLSKRLSVAEYGATGNGETDDSAAFQKAFQDAVALDACAIYVPPGKYRLKTMGHGGGTSSFVI